MTIITGTKISVFGFFPPVPQGKKLALVNYTIDNSPPISKSSPNASGQAPFLLQTMFASDELKNGRHTLKLQLLDDADFNLTGFEIYPDGPKKSHTAAIVGGVLGGVLAVAICIIFLIFLRRRRSKRAAMRMSSDPRIMCSRMSKSCIVNVSL